MDVGEYCPGLGVCAHSGGEVSQTVVNMSELRREE